MKVSHYLSGAVRQFSYWFVHGTLGYPILEGIDYLNELEEDSSCMEQAFSIFMNNIELDNEGNVLNYKYCEKELQNISGDISNLTIVLTSHSRIGN